MIAGRDVLDVFNRFTYSRTFDQQPTNRLYYLGNPGPFNAFPNPLFRCLQIHVRPRGLHQPRLFRVTILPLHAQPEAAPGVRWTGIPGITNRVEISETQGPWRLLTNVISSGATEDSGVPGTSLAPEFFRIRIGD